MASEANTIRDIGVAAVKVQDTSLRVKINNAADINILTISGTYR
jgi:hypothetical protein